MAKEQITTNGTGGKILCTEKEVYIESLPRCLRHYQKSVPLEDAIRITKMLHIIFMAFEDNDWWTEGEEGLKGVDLVLRLLLDKLEIASGEYRFPNQTIIDDAPSLEHFNIDFLYKKSKLRA